MDAFSKALFNTLGKRYEMLVYENSRRSSIAAQRFALNLPPEVEVLGEAQLKREIELTERLLAVMAEHKQNDF